MTLLESVNVHFSLPVLIAGSLAHSSSVSSDISNRTKLDVVCVIDTVQTSNLAHRKRVSEEVKQACSMANANLVIVSVIYTH